MCTLGGFVRTTARGFDYGMVKRIVEGIDLRGRDSFGVVAWYGKLDGFRRYWFTDKAALMPTVQNMISEGARAVMLVGRAIPAAERVDGVNHERDTQPFIAGGIAVAHNGLISNDAELREELHLSDLSPVDTAVLPYLFAQSGDYLEQVEKLEGSFALAVLDSMDAKLRLATNFMPLWMYGDGGCIYWGSDQRQSPDHLERVPYHSVVTINLDTGEQHEARLLNELHPDRVVVVCSGGMDSSTTAVLYKALGYEVDLVHFRYGQHAEEVEEWATAKLAEHLGVHRVSLEMRDVFAQASESLLLRAHGRMSEEERAKLRHLDMESTMSYVGARNLVFSSIAMSIAESVGAATVALGLNIDDSSYPDNNVTFLDELTDVGSVALNWHKRVRIRAPFVHLTKKEILEVALAIGAPLDLHASCYYPEFEGDGLAYCGACGCDKLREFSFRALGLIDPVPYRGIRDWSGCQDVNDARPDYLRRRKHLAVLRPEQVPYINFMVL